MLSRRSCFIAITMTLCFASVTWCQNVVAGTWNGTLPKADLPLVFQFKADGSGTVDSTKQNFHSAATIRLSGDDVNISVPAVQGTFTGTLTGGKMTGTWSQGSGYSDSLVLVKQ